MIAERVPGSLFIRVYDNGGSYEQGSPIRFAVGHDRSRDEPGWAQLEAGMGTLTGDVWRAIEHLLAAEGYHFAEWEVVDTLTNAYGDSRPRPRKVLRRVRNPVACSAPSAISATNH